MYEEFVPERLAKLRLQEVKRSRKMTAFFLLFPISS